MGDMAEVWTDVLNYENTYDVSNLGRIRSKPRMILARKNKRKYFIAGKIRSQQYGRGGYKRVILHKNGIQKYLNVHRIVWESFVGVIKSGLEICHINNVRDDNRLENLRVDTHINNCKDKHIHGTRQNGERNGNSILKNCEVDEIKRLMLLGVKQSFVSKMFKISQSTVSAIKKGRIRK
jgi:hypothetical protein